MSDAPTAAARRVGSGTTRLVRAWRALPHESQLAAFASIGLFLTLFLPWYQVTLIARAQSAKLQSASVTITGWGAFSFVEAAVLLVAASVLTLLFQRAEGRAFHLPGGDGGVITAAGVWTCVLIIWRIFDKQVATTNGPSATSSGVEWGIFIALAAGAFLTYSGSRIRAAHRPEPPLPGEDHAPAGSNAAADTTTEPRRPRERRSEPRRRARAPRPVSADRPVSVADRRPSVPADRRPAAPADRPRHRVTADELFERVVPEDPPVMRFGRITPSSRPSFRPSPEPTSDDDPVTMPFRDDETTRLGEDKTLPLGADDTLPLGADDTMPLGVDETVALGADDTLPLGADDTLPLTRRRRPER
ncbi:MAG: hypothetical protein ACLP4R_04500 [Solirubrobacteraceae bacterium]